MDDRRQGDLKLGELSGKMDMVLQSLTSIHDKIESINDRCPACKKDILEQAKQTSKEISKSENKSTKLWVTVAVIIFLVSFAGTITTVFMLTPIQKIIQNTEAKK